MRERVVCPKCNSESARYVADHQDVYLRCLCGYAKVVASKLNDMTIEHIAREEEVTLPRQGSKLYHCLAMLVALQKATTRQVAESLNLRPGHDKQSMSDVASQLTVLRYKGLVIVPEGEERKGTSGGSTWILSEAGKRLFK